MVFPNDVEVSGATHNCLGNVLYSFTSALQFTSDIEKGACSEKLGANFQLSKLNEPHVRCLTAMYAMNWTKLCTVTNSTDIPYVQAWNYSRFLSMAFKTKPCSWDIAMLQVFVWNFYLGIPNGSLSFWPFLMKSCCDWPPTPQIFSSAANCNA